MNYQNNEDGTTQLPPGRLVTRGKGAGIEYLVEECPKCGKENHFYWNTERHEGVCHSCKFTVKGLRRFKLVFQNSLSLYQTPPWERIEVSDLGNPLKHFRRWEYNAWDHPKSRDYLIGRRVTEDLSRSVPIYYLPEKDLLCVTIDPISEEYSKEATLYRGLSGWPPKFRPLSNTEMSKYGFGIRHIPSTRRVAAVFEGAFDVLTTNMLGWAMGLLGTSWDENWCAWWKTRFDYLVFWFDPDKAGRAASEKIRKDMEIWGIKYTCIENSVEPGDLHPKHSMILQLREHLEQADIKFKCPIS